MYYEELEKIEDELRKELEEKYSWGLFKCNVSYIQDLDSIKITLNGYRKDNKLERYLYYYVIAASEYENLKCNFSDILKAMINKYYI